MSEKTTPNIYDIAEQAGVSIATVSRVLSGSAKVREQTRQRVLQVVGETGYTPNAFARGLGTGSMKMVGILCTDVSDIYYAGAVSLLEHLLRQNGLDTLLYCTGNSLTDKKRFLSQLLAKHVDAILLVGSAFKEQSDNSHIEQAAGQVPVIIVNGLVECAGVYCVLCDEHQAMEENVRRLYERGCRHILYLYDATTYSGIRKLEGYRDGLAACGLELDEALVVRCQKDVDAAREQADTLLEKGVAIDGILASEDLLAIGACKAAAQRGLNLPAVGFNNSVLARCSTPALSSVDNMAGTLCSTAVNMLGDLLDGKSNIPSKIVVNTNFVQRET